MAVAYRLQPPPASPDLIDDLEQRIGRPLPSSYRDFLVRQDGGWLAANDEAIKVVFGLGDVPVELSMWHKLDVFHDRLPVWLLPVAQDAYGNLFAISLRDEDLGSVWFWDHEEEADEGEPPSEDNIDIKARDWQAFLDGLRPLDQPGREV
jgi:cell wall assembly regulator SMI1